MSRPDNKPSDSSNKRRLPLLQPRDGEGQDDVEPRPPWQWSGIGALAVFISWNVLSMLLGAARKLVAEELAPGHDPASTAEAIKALSPAQRIALSLLVVVGPMVGLVIAGLLGGFLVGRFGAPAGKNEAMAGGAIAGVVASALEAPRMLATGQGGMWALQTAIIVVLASISARGGAALGLRRRLPQR